MCEETPVDSPLCFAAKQTITCEEGPLYYTHKRKTHFLKDEGRLSGELLQISQDRFAVTKL